MDHLFIDTNLVIDLLTGRSGFYEDAQELSRKILNSRIHVKSSRNSKFWLIFYHWTRK